MGRLPTLPLAHSGGGLAGGVSDPECRLLVVVVAVGERGGVYGIVSIV